MKKTTTPFFFIVLLFFLVGSTSLVKSQNIVTNGDFESWTGGQPDGWTTIDPGITVTQETTIIHGGSSSASVDVTTATQGNTDFRQTVSVTGGISYDVSVWVYHTEGNMKARLYVAGYQGYSDNTITGAWQEMTYTYTYPADTNIEIGLRFYDQTGFDGNEIVYVDDYVISPASGGGNTQALYLEAFTSDLGTTTHYSVTGDNQVWEWANYGNPPGCSKMNGYSGGAQENEDWLITDAINCDNYINVTLSFDHARNYADNSGLFVLVSNDYDGVSDPTTSGTWNDITSQFTFPDPGGWSFIDAGTVDISTYTGSTTYIAFKYTSDNTAAATWEVDNVLVEGELNISAFIAGSFNSWNPSDPDFQMSLNANGLFELTKNLPAGTNEYKVVEDGNWYPGNNQQIILTTATDTTWKYNYTDNLVTHTMPTVTGDFWSLLGGTNWDAGEPLGEMADPDGDDVYTLDVVIPAGDYECKITLNKNWDQSTGGNTPFTTDGVNATTFTYDFPNNITTVSGPPPVMDTVTFVVIDTAGRNYDGFFLKGSWDASGFYDPTWGGGMEHSAFYDDGTNGDTLAGDHVWACQQLLAVDGGSNTWEWGVNDTEHNWVAGNWQFTVPDDTPQTLSWEVPNTPELVINEIMYNSPGADEEWIEIYNGTGSSVDLENWKVLDSDGNHSPIVIPAGYSIADSGYFTIEVATNGDFPFTPDYDGSGNFQLNNGGDDVRLYNADGILVDIVSYSDSDPWPTAPDGDGPTLALIDPASDNSLPQNWAASEQDGGTPGAINFPPVPFIMVTSPDGGEYIEQGSQWEITWSYGFWDGNIKIELVKDGEDPQEIVYNLPASDLSYMWDVFDDQELGNDYKIRISGINDSDPVGESDDYFSIIAPYVLPDIVITEIMYNPPESGEDSLEFLEFYNNSTDTVNMKGLYMSAGVDYVFPDIDMLPDTFLLLAKDSMAMQFTFGVQAYQWTSGALSNGGENVELSDSLGNVVDFVPYDDALPWDTLADGWGPSLTLCNPNLDNSLPQNWTASVNFAAINADGDSIWATPGFACQVSLMAGFEADKTIVPVGDSVLFTDLTVGNPISWNWNFEGGMPETYNGQTPPYIHYDSPGFWDVTLVVSDGMNTDSITYENYIYSGYAPQAGFDADVRVILSGNYVDFTSLSTGDSLSYQWYFEGGTPDQSTDENPEFIYYLIDDHAFYDVTLIVTNAFGSDSLTQEDYIEVIPVGINDHRLTDQEVILYPNPTDGQVNIELPAGIEANLKIYDFTGKTLFDRMIVGSEKLNLNMLNQGIYFMKFTDPELGSVVVKRLVIR